VSASRNRLQWIDVPSSRRTTIEALIGGRVVHAESCVGGYSPGLASRLTLDHGGRVFVKAMDGHAWPLECAAHRAEVVIAKALPVSGSTPRFIGSFDDGRWVVLAFEDIDGVTPASRGVVTRWTERPPPSYDWPRASRHRRSQCQVTIRGWADGPISRPPRCARATQ
jgi:hypothetical protein